MTRILFNFNDFFASFNNLFGNIFQFLITMLGILLVVCILLVLFSKGSNGIKPLIGSFIGIVACVALNFIIFGSFPTLPPFLQFVEDWIRALFGIQ